MSRPQSAGNRLWDARARSGATEPKPPPPPAKEPPKPKRVVLRISPGKPEQAVKKLTTTTEALSSEERDLIREYREIEQITRNYNLKKGRG